MVALAADRNTAERTGEDMMRPVVAGAKIFAGALVCLNAAGWAIPGAVSLTLKADGRADKFVDNTGGANGAKLVPVSKGTFRFANSAAGDLITQADIGTDCFVVDDQTVAKTNGAGTRSIAGKVVDVDTVGVWVRFV